MKILTKSIQNKLQKAAHSSMKPIVKFFNPCGAATWLICSMEENNDTMWGYADLGMGCVEFGTISLSELQSVRLPFNLKIERDLHWQPIASKDYTEILSQESMGTV